MRSMYFPATGFIATTLCMSEKVRPGRCAHGRMNPMMTGGQHWAFSGAGRAQVKVMEQRALCGRGGFVMDGRQLLL
jgi:hypothetical protein